STVAMMFRVSAMVAALLLVPVLAQGQLRATAGPVRPLAISPDGTRAISGSFDTSVIRWSLSNNAAECCRSMTARSTRLSSSATALRHQRGGHAFCELDAGRAADVEGARGA